MESDCIKILFTLDDFGHSQLKQGIHYDLTIANSMRNIFQSSYQIIRVAIPYITQKGLIDFSEMVDIALQGHGELEFIFRTPEKESDFQIHKTLHNKYLNEIKLGKIWFGYYGKSRGSGLHAKVIIKDDSNAMISSANWTNYSLYDNAEAGVLTKSKRAINYLINWFELIKQNTIGWNHLNRTK